MLRPGEKLTHALVIDATGSRVTCVRRFAWEIWQQHGEKDGLIPPFFVDVRERYCARVANYSLPASARFRQIHDGHCSFLQPAERCLVTPEEIRERVGALEPAGIRESTLLPPVDHQIKVYRDVAEMVMPALR